MDYQTLPTLFADSAESLTEAGDRELLERLLASMKATEESDWNRVLIAKMLAKLGKQDQCKQVIGDISARWERADALRECDLIDEAIAEATAAQGEGTEQDQQCASGVLADIADIYSQKGEYDRAEKIIDTITHPIRQQRAMDRLRELRGDTVEQNDDY
jgi:hypothetical protein